MKLKARLPSHFAFALGAPALIWQVLLFYLPLFLLLFFSVVHFSDEGVFQEVSFAQWTLFFNSIYLTVIASSLLLAISNTILCFSIAFPFAYFIAFKVKKWKNLFLILLIIPFWTNFLLHVYAWFFVLEREGMLNNLLMALGIIQEPLHMLNTLFSVMIMMVYYYLPFMVLPIYSSLEKIDYRLVEASYDLGATFFQTFRRVILPMSGRGLLAGFFLVYIPSFGEFAIPELMGGDKQMFVGSVVSHYILGEETGSLGAAFTAVSTMFLLASALGFYFLIKRFLKTRTDNG